MKRLFLSIRKGEELRFLGHLDYLRTLTRAITRSGIPVAYSEGFNPHMKISLDAALGVGVTAEPLYLEIKTEKDISPEEILRMMTPQMPKGMEIEKIREADDKWPKFAGFFTEDAYEMEGPVLPGANEEKMKENIRTFNEMDSFIYTRVTPKKTREMDVKPLIIEPMKVWLEGGRAHLTFSLVRSQNGSVQPKDIWKLLAESFGMPWTADTYICSRTGAYKRAGGRRFTPFDEGAF